MSNHQEIDRRITRSKKALREALISLMQEKDLKSISITDIVQLADVNRGTFYKHYHYKEDILAEIIEEVMTDLIASYREPYMNSTTFEVSELEASAIKIFDHVNQYSSFYSLIVHSHALSNFQHRICHVLKELALNDLFSHLPNPNVNRDLLASYHAYAIWGMIIEWVNGQFKYSPSYMAEQLLEIIHQTKIND